METRRWLIERHGPVCAYCERTVPERTITLDHVTPRSRGGESNWENLVACCHECNRDMIALRGAGDVEYDWCDGCERLFFDLKEVLNLNRVYTANPNAVAMQVYAAGCVYNALRVAQAEVAETAGLDEEQVRQIQARLKKLLPDGKTVHQGMLGRRA